MLISKSLQNESSEVSIKTRSTLASLSLKGQATKHTTVKWVIAEKDTPKYGETLCDTSTDTSR